MLRHRGQGLCCLRNVCLEKDLVEEFAAASLARIRGCGGEGVCMYKNLIFDRVRGETITLPVCIRSDARGAFYTEQPRVGDYRLRVRVSTSLRDTVI